MESSRSGQVLWLIITVCINIPLIAILIGLLEQFIHKINLVSFPLIVFTY